MILLAASKNETQKKKMIKNANVANFSYPSLRRTLFLALSLSLNANAVEVRIIFLIDLIFAVNSCFM